MKVGAYNASTGVWTDGATYGIKRSGNNFKAFGLIPYGQADSVHPTAGYRFATKIIKDGVNNIDSLPSGNIVKVTNVNEVSGYNVYTKSAFETDGSLINIFAPRPNATSKTFEIKIAWTKAGSSVTDSDFTTYTFDLSEVTFQAVPETLIPFEEGQSVTGFNFGDVQNNEMNAGLQSFLEGLTYDAETGYAILLEGTISGTTACGLRARYNGSNYTLFAYMGEQQLPVYESTGYKNLTNGVFGFMGATAVVSVGGIHDTTPASWNGIYIGAVTG